MPLEPHDFFEGGRIYEMEGEPRTKEELEEISYDFDKIRMLALKVRERVLGCRHADTTYYIR